ncbi:MAG: phosphoribosyl-AMP cyclohydrolase, partial [Cenarchaeum sp. SB0669_bin_11]|nr:phosphoribosyl-AMP cyclohydrolase [Cenarchaeum sp. SB0669_bin_11]
MKVEIASLDFNKGDGLIPVIVQDEKTREVLTLAYCNREALERTIKTKKSWFWSRSRR